MRRTKPITKTNPYADPDYRMPWGRFAGRRIRDIPAQYFLDDILAPGWAFGDIQEWIQDSLEELKERARKEEESGYRDLFYKYKQWKPIRNVNTRR